LAQGFQKSTAVLVIRENGFAPVAPIHDVVNRTRILDSQFARQDQQFAKLCQLCRPLDWKGVARAGSPLVQDHISTCKCAKIRNRLWLPQGSGAPSS
jgi:hypothetical protein